MQCPISAVVATASPSLLGQFVLILLHTLLLCLNPCIADSNITRLKTKPDERYLPTSLPGIIYLSQPDQEICHYQYKNINTTRIESLTKDIKKGGRKLTGTYEL